MSTKEKIVIWILIIIEVLISRELIDLLFNASRQLESKSGGSSDVAGIMLFGFPVVLVGFFIFAIQKSKDKTTTILAITSIITLLLMIAMFFK
jgi:hypothetical protein